MSLVLIGSLLLAGMGGTLATWSDSETSLGNYIETGSVDLLVARCDSDWSDPGPFKDDLPWGVGLDPCFDALLVTGGHYTCYSLLWNAGCVDGKAYLHTKTVSDSDALASYTTMSIWYDDDGQPDTPLALVASDTVANLDCHEIKLGDLPAQAIRQLKLEVEYAGPCPAHDLCFDTIFQLTGNMPLESMGFKRFGLADSEISENCLSAPE
jgi:predicted ribosomally synthesized peptide with SipW-like signal peptide